MNIISEVLSACVSSARAGPIKLREGRAVYETRGQLHALILMPFGSGKTTELVRLRDRDIVEAKQFRLPGFVGTISRDGDFLEGAIARAAGKTLIIDEVHNLSAGSREAMLNLLEGDWYQRDLGFRLRSPVRKSRRYLKIRAKEGHMNIWSQFSCIAAGIKVGRRHFNDMAWISRFMPISISLTDEEAYDLSMGRRIFKIKKRPYEECPVFEDYEKFWKIHMETQKKLKFADFLRCNPGFLRRNLCDFSRLFAWNSCHNSTVVDWEKYVPYIPWFLYNYVASTLSLTEFRILSLYNDSQGDIKQKDIAENVGCSEVYVSSSLKKLRGIGLL